MGHEMPPSPHPEKEKNPKDTLKKILNRIGVFVLAGSMLEGAGIGEFVRAELGMVSQEKIELKEKEDRVRNLLGEKVIRNIAHASESTNNKETGSERKEMRIDDFPTADGELSSEAVRDYLDAFPQNWVVGEIDSITYRDREGLSEATKAAFYDLGRRTGPIEFYRLSQESSIPALTYDLAHEVAHANDWDSDNEMSYEERLELVMQIAERINAPDRYQSEYVESISGENEREVTATKTREYWAEIAAVYAVQPTALNAKDFAIVDAVAKKNDPDFVVGTIKERRGEVIRKSIPDKNIVKIYGFAQDKK